MSIITAFGLKQFAQPLPPTGPPANQQLIVSHVTPFGARVWWEIIHAPGPVKATRPTGANLSDSDYYESEGQPTIYVHQLIGQRTLPLYLSYPECGKRDDGWCEMGMYLQILGGLLDQAQYHYSCFGKYPSPPYGSITNGVPNTNATMKKALGARSLGYKWKNDRFWV